MQWMMFAETEIARGPNDARLHDKFGYNIEAGLARKMAARVYDLLEWHLSTMRWLACGRPTIADGVLSLRRVGA